jgi:hypothetical protein
VGSHPVRVLERREDIALDGTNSQWVHRHHYRHYAPPVAFQGVARQASRYLPHSRSIVEQRNPKRQGCAKSRLRLSSQPKHPGKHRNNHDHHDNSERQYPT